MVNHIHYNNDIISNSNLLLKYNLIAAFLIFAYLLMFFLIFAKIRNFFNNKKTKIKIDKYINSFNLFNNDFKIGLSKLLTEKRIKLQHSSNIDFTYWNGIWKSENYLLEDCYELDKSNIVIEIVLDYINKKLIDIKDKEDHVLKALLVQQLILKYVEEQELNYPINHKKELEKFKII